MISVSNFFKFMNHGFAKYFVFNPESECRAWQNGSAIDNIKDENYRATSNSIYGSSVLKKDTMHKKI